MSTSFEHRLASEHPAEDIWQAIRTPLTGRVAAAVHPWFEIDYVLLGEGVQIEAGTHIHYRPRAASMDRVPEPFRRKIPEVITFLVEESDPDSRVRRDVLQSTEATGTIQYGVEEVGSNGLLVVKGGLSIAGRGAMAEGPAIERAIYEPAQRLLENLPEIIQPLRS